MIEIIVDVLLEAFLDSLKALPFLVLCFALLEFLEHRAGARSLRLLESTRKAGPVLGSVLGVLPQCGFSIMASNLYAGGAITLGTLLAVFLSTSDEAFIILLSNPTCAPDMLAVIGIKIVCGIVFGYLLDLILKRCAWAQPTTELRHKHEEHCHPGCGCGCNSRRDFVLAVVRHSLSVFAFIFVISLVLGLVIEFVGYDALAGTLLTGSVLQPILAAIVGLIPNCAASVLLAELYAEGVLTFASLLAGLCAASGMGLLTLFRANRNMKANLLMLSVLYGLSVAIGFAAMAF